MPRVTINGATGATPTSGMWQAETEGECIVLTASGPATLLVHTPAGDVEVEAPAGRDATVTLKPGVATVEFS